MYDKSNLGEEVVDAIKEFADDYDKIEKSNLSIGDKILAQLNRIKELVKGFSKKTGHFVLKLITKGIAIGSSIVAWTMCIFVVVARNIRHEFKRFKESLQNKNNADYEIA